MSQLSKIFGHKPSTLTSILDRLEGRGLLERRPNPDDRRSVLVSTTKRGTEAATELRVMLEEMEEEIYEQINARDFAGFQAVMKAIGDLTKVDLTVSE